MACGVVLWHIDATVIRNHLKNSMAPKATASLYNSTTPCPLASCCYTTPVAFGVVLWMHFWNSFPRGPYVKFLLKKSKMQKLYQNISRLPSLRLQSTVLQPPFPCLLGPSTCPPPTAPCRRRPPPPLRGKPRGRGGLPRAPQIYRLRAVSRAVGAVSCEKQPAYHPNRRYAHFRYF
jgi:hypothetical protein